MPPHLSPDLHRLLDSDQLLQLREVAARLRIPLSTAREWSRRGVFPVVRIGRRVFVRAVSLHDWIREHEHHGRDTT